MKPEIDTLQGIIEYCEALQNDRQFFGDDMEQYMGDERYQHSAIFTLFQIEELTKNTDSIIQSNYSSLQANMAITSFVVLALSGKSLILSVTKIVGGFPIDA